jgi:hypothetical protein
MKTPNGNGKRAAKRAVHAHERQMHPGKPLTKLPNGKSAKTGRAKP